MLQLDPPTLLLANLLVGLTLVLVVMSTRVGLGSGARGMRSWLAGDVVLLTGQAVIAIDAVDFGRLLAIPPLTLSSGLVTAGIALHLVGIHRHVRPAGSALRRVLPYAIAFGLGLFVAVGSLLTAEPAYRVMLLHVVLVAMLVVTIARELVPVRRFFGVRILMAAMGFAVVANVLLLIGAAVRPGEVLKGAMPGLLINMVMTMLTTSAFVLWLQEELRETLRRAAHTDLLTGVLNRYGVLPQLRRELARTARQGTPLSVALCDIDHFKNINDTQGHAAGDSALQAFSSALLRHVRASDLVARWGGEEFLLVLPDTDAAHAKAALERMQVRMAVEAQASGGVTFSVGIASTTDGAATDIDALLARADRRLYAAKATRNTVVAD
ncbi:diguanylate cyclase (GGDEF) domain-containing protein [Variovorax sp. OK605]|uniref:GGDEF domain-containing protein n=1 Tax=Variovorax sp. OK605 TaxID=1855317 RepID=UPI0008F2DA5F|nr:GGDEF domain-containing protein [Variovorax sp. OK605]SFO55881.1 diguanylate cyclase (GGDEF) domain-containing protein [Variovorax sp. OK605]